MSARLEDLFLKLGRPGRYQILIFAILQFQYVFFAACFLGLSFWPVVPALNCTAPENLEKQNYTELCSIGQNDDMNSTEISDTCQILHGHRVIGKIQFVSMAMEWGFVCHKQYTVALLQTLFFCGTMFGGIIFGPLADRFGRKPIAFTTLFLAASLGTLISFIEHFYIFAVCKLLQGVLLQGFNSTTNCLKTEILHSEYRARIVAIGDALGMSLPMFYLAISAYLTQNWRYVELGMNVPLLLTFGCIWIVPESLRWLIKMKRSEDALIVIQQLTKYNGLPVPVDIKEELDAIIAEIDEDSKLNRGSDIRDLFRTPRLALYSFIFSFSWFTWLLLNYGIMFSMASLSGNLFVNFIILGVVDLIFRCVAYLLLLRCEGRTVTCLGLAMTGVLLVTTAVVQVVLDPYSSGITSTTLAMMARAFIGFFVVATYIHLSEVFPTPLRATAYGLFAATGRAGALLSSQVVALGDLSWKQLPFIIMGAAGLLAGLGNLLLPATRDKPMPNTIHETLKLHKSSKSKLALEEMTKN